MTQMRRIRSGSDKKQIRENPPHPRFYLMAGSGDDLFTPRDVVPDDVAVQLAAGREEDAALAALGQLIGELHIFRGLFQLDSRKMLMVIPSRAHSSPSRSVATSVLGWGG